MIDAKGGIYVKKSGLSQEMLKIIACLTMLVDHVGATVVIEFYTRTASLWLYYLYWGMRIVGRVAFPIYCFLLAEGAHYTRNPKKYALRLFIGVLLAELPFDAAFCDGWTWEHQSVMITLLLGFAALEGMGKCKNPLLKMLIVVPFALAAEWMKTDYGGYGVAMIALFGLTREMPDRTGVQLAGLALIACALDSATFPIAGIKVPIELFAVFAMIPISWYSGKKSSGSRMIQTGFYLFYPVHLALLAVIVKAVFGG